MTKEEAIEYGKDYLKDLVSASCNISEKHKDFVKMALQALEQESILDKIRAEIHATAEMHEDGNYYLREEWIDEIFDKYKGESEDNV